MVKYEYRPELEVFRRIDNRGPSLKFNIVEARRIQSLMDLGYKAPSIMNKIDFVNDVSMTNLRTFMNNLIDGNINLEGDYPAPTELVESMTDNDRLNRLEERMALMENAVAVQKKSRLSKVKSWIVRK